MLTLFWLLTTETTRRLLDSLGVVSPEWLAAQRRRG